MSDVTEAIKAEPDLANVRLIAMRREDVEVPILPSESFVPLDAKGDEVLPVRSIMLRTEDTGLTDPDELVQYLLAQLAEYGYANDETTVVGLLIDRHGAIAEPYHLAIASQLHHVVSA